MQNEATVTTAARLLVRSASWASYAMSVFFLIVAIQTLHSGAGSATPYVAESVAFNALAQVMDLRYRMAR